jgi:NhaP-type Na+/H+ and K+/H+ antiporter
MTTTPSSRPKGLGLVLIAVYGLLALAATGRSVYQIASEFDNAPLAYSLSALAGIVYIVATIALVAPGPTWYRIAWFTIAFELLGVLVVGTLSVFDPELFTAKAVWSFYGRGYGFVPLVLPILGMLWLYSRRPGRVVQSTRQAA